MTREVVRVINKIAKDKIATTKNQYIAFEYARNEHYEVKASHNGGWIIKLKKEDGYDDYKKEVDEKSNGATYYMRHLTGSQVAMMKRKYYVFKVVREK